MQTEHLGNVRPSWIAFGWFLGAGATAAVLFALIALGVIGDDVARDDRWMLFAFVVGFTVGGYLAGWRAGMAPVLHGVGIGLFSVVVWLVANLLFGEPTGTATWSAISAPFAAVLLLVQIASATIGAWLGTSRSSVSVAGGDGEV